MIDIIVAFPKVEHAESIKRILIRSGFEVDAVATTGAQALQLANDLDGGILISYYRFADMMYEELYEYLPPTFQMLLLAAPAVCQEREIENLICLAMPLKVYELVQTLEMISYSIEMEKKRRIREHKPRSDLEQKLLTRAKGLLMERNNMSEKEAHRYLQKCSMDSGTGLVETARMILSMMK